MPNINYRVSLNQIVEFSKATNSNKLAIAKQQVQVNPFLIPWYQLAKNRIKKYFYNTDKLLPILEAIEILKNRTPRSKRQQIDKKVSIEALNRMILLKIPTYFKGLRYEIIKVPEKSMYVCDVLINVNPDLIIKSKINGYTVYGGLKIHLSKGKPFDIEQCYNAAAILHKFIANNIAKEHDVVSPELCFCLDVFGNRLVSSPIDYSKNFMEIDRVCREFISVWDQVNQNNS